MNQNAESTTSTIYQPFIPPAPEATQPAEQATEQITARRRWPRRLLAGVAVVTALAVTASIARIPVNSRLASVNHQLLSTRKDLAVKSDALKAALAPPTPPAPNYGQLYLDQIDPTNAAEKAFYAISLPGNTTAQQWLTVAAPYAKAIDTTNQALLRIDWPAQFAPDVKATIQASSAVAADLATAGWGSLTADEQKWHTASSVVRADLKLPPPS